MDEAALRATYARAMAARGADRASCPLPEALRDLATTDTHDDQAASAFDHVMSCTPCRDEYELLRSIHRAQATGSVTPARRWMPFALAATALVAVALGSTIVRQREATRGTGEDVRLVAPSTDAARADSLRLAWHPVEGAESYRVELLDASGAALHTVTTADTSVSLPPGTIGNGTPAFDWLVVALRSDGSVRRSGLARVVLTP